MQDGRPFVTVAPDFRKILPAAQGAVAPDAFVADALFVPDQTGPETGHRIVNRNHDHQAQNTPNNRRRQKRRRTPDDDGCNQRSKSRIQQKLERSAPSRETGLFQCCLLYLLHCVPDPVLPKGRIVPARLRPITRSKPRGDKAR